MSEGGASTLSHRHAHVRTTMLLRQPSVRLAAFLERVYNHLRDKVKSMNPVALADQPFALTISEECSTVQRASHQQSHQNSHTPKWVVPFKAIFQEPKWWLLRLPQKPSEVLCLNISLRDKNVLSLVRMESCGGGSKSQGRLVSTTSES